MMNRIVVMGGSFNPPTRAHLQLMEAALEAVDACQGVFVPTAHDYVAKKMKRQKCPQDTLGESIRLEMLESFRKYDSRISVSRIQMLKTERGYDYEMLEEIQADFPDTEVTSSPGVISCMFCRDGIGSTSFWTGSGSL